MRNLTPPVACALIAASFALAPRPAMASSHMDAPLITLDDAANTTDVYAFITMYNGVKSLTTALAVYPFEEPGIGPNKYNFDDDVLYEIHVAAGNDDVQAGRATYSYQFRFSTTFRNRNTILQSYLGVIQDVGDSAQNLIQRYTVTKIDQRARQRFTLGTGIVPPNNQGNATPFYNRGDNGESPAKDGVATDTFLDRYTRQSIASLFNGYTAFAGQRDDGFYADVQAVFDLLRLRAPGRDSQSGYNIHQMVLNIPLDDIGGDRQVIGVYATTSRRTLTILSEGQLAPIKVGPFVQVGRQGNPLFNEALVGIADKDLYNRTSPTSDATLFKKYALSPELAALLNSLVFGSPVAPTTNRTDIAGIFIPDLIKVDASTDPARLAGSGPSHPTNPDDPGFSRLSIFGNDVLFSPLKNAFMPGGWPNGRRFGDDVLDIAVSALISDLRGTSPIIRTAGDNVDRNDIGYNKVFPYAATPLNGRTHSHHFGPGTTTPQ
jgi:hypothetical protein